MANGILAIRGFDYQATVILDLLFDHFDRRGPTAFVRPEGKDDLDLRWTEDNEERSCFVQVKKPAEDEQARLNPSPWTLADVSRELLPKTFNRLAANTHQQVWVLGDKVADQVRALFTAGFQAPAEASDAYWTVVHGLARTEAQQALPAGSDAAKAVSRWRAPNHLPTDPTQAKAALIKAAEAFGQAHGATGVMFTQRYTQELERVHTLLPSVLGRTRIADLNGTEIEVAERVMQLLEQRYGLQRTVIEYTLFRNLRGFINDISKQPERSFDLEELETEVRCCWPHMIPIKAPPPLDEDHMARPAIAAVFTNRWTGTVVEIVGTSGAGKTRLAAEILDRSRRTDPGRIGLYAEVRSDVSLRDCLVGAAFKLRRLGLSAPFALAIRPELTEGEILTTLARAFSEMPHESLLLLDLVDGVEPPGFVRDLATFVRTMSSNAMRLVVFGQERPLRDLSALEQSQLGVRSFDVPGLTFHEFAALVGRRHPDADQSLLSKFYDQITAGRAGGLNVSLAQALARVRTEHEMASIIAQPAENRLAYAERNRFSRLGDGVRPAAEKLTCFALPFQRLEAEAVFGDDNVGLAIRELLDLGLLRRHDADTFEMHETVRAGLEELLPPQTRRAAHGALATWYGKQGQTNVQILHLERAGRSQEAQARAREVFLAGESWVALWPYVARHRLVSTAEVFAIIASPQQVDGTYLLPQMLQDLGEAPFADALMGLIRDQVTRVFSEHNWARSIIEALLTAESSRLDELVEFLIKTMPTPDAAESALTWVSISMRRKKCVIGPATLSLFDGQPEAVQKLLLGLMLSGGRGALQQAFQYILTHPEFIEKQRNGGWPNLVLNVHSSEDAADILASIPIMQPAEMICSRGPRLGPLGGLIWHVRKALRVECVAALQAQALNSDALANAIRILIFLGEPTLLDLCGNLRARTDAAGTLARLVPAITPSLVDWHPYEARILDQTAEFDDRSQALITLAWSGARLDDLLDRLQATEPQNWPRWRHVLRIIAPVNFFAATIPILKEALVSGDDKEAHLIVAIIARLGTASGSDVTAVLVQALSHRLPWVRLSACITLAHRRDHAVLPSLIERYGLEVAPEIQAVLATAIISSGATSGTNLAAHSGTPAADLWWCILVHRTRDLHAADRLISLAANPAQPWLVRRAAIAAAGQLPYDAALACIEVLVMAERSSFILDRHQSRLGHEAMALIISTGKDVFQELLAQGRESFVSFFSGIFETLWLEKIDRRGLPLSSEAAGWLYSQLADNGWPINTTALDKVLNGLHVPLLQAAVLRALRLCNRPDRIEVHLTNADHVWLAIRALLERSKFGERGPTVGQKLRSFVTGRAWADNWCVNDLINRLATPPASPTSHVSAAMPTPVPVRPVNVPLTFETAVSILSDGVGGVGFDGPLVLEPLTEEECSTLIRLAAPDNDAERGEITFIPSVAFTKEGHQVNQRRTTYSGGPSLPDRLRPAIAAANCLLLPIPWHAARLDGPLADNYASDFLDCLVAQRDSVRFYAALAAEEEILMPALCKKAQALPTQVDIDDRLIPTLTRFLAVGGDDFFEGLCILAKCIDDPKILPVLEGLLHRWVQRFEVRASAPQRTMSHFLWRAFARLSEHPRFGAIPAWPRQLEMVLQTPIAWYHAQSIIRILERDPGSYTLIEARLFKEANWEHYNDDEVERLDRAAEKLFMQFRRD